MSGCVVTAIFGFLYFAMLNTGLPAYVFLGVFLSLILRYSGASIGYQLASIIAGGPAPLIATWLLARYHSGYAIAICCVISFAAVSAMHDYTGQDIHEEYDLAVATMPEGAY